MIEVRSAYLVKMKDVRHAMALLKEGREQVWPVLGWQGRLQQMLHGHAQQSLFLWSSEWENMAAWEEGMARTLGCQEYQDWSKEMNQDNTPGRIEVRSSYIVRVQNVKQARAIMQQGQKDIWPALDWSGQNQQMLHGKASQSMFVWSSVWDNLGAWEQGMARTVNSEEFQPWYRDFKNVVDFGGPREIFKNL